MMIKKLSTLFALFVALTISTFGQSPVAIRSLPTASAGNDTDVLIDSQATGGSPAYITRQITGLQLKLYMTGGGSLGITSGKTLSIANTLTFSGTDGATLNVGTGGTLGTGAFAAAYTLPAATTGTIGGVKPGTDLTVAGDGTLSFAPPVQAPNVVLAGPESGSSAAPTFRALVAADIPLTFSSPLADTAGAISLSTSGVTAGTYTNSNITVDSFGRVTAASNGSSASLSFTSPLVNSSGTISLANSGATAGSYTNANITIDALGRVTSAANGSAGSSGTVTSVGMTVPAWLTVGGSPVTASGVLAVTGTSEAANLFLASPNGSAGAVSPRALVAADLPTSGATAGSYTNANITIDTYGRVTAAANGTGGGGTIPVTQGGTGLTSLSLGQIIAGSASNTFSAYTLGSGDLTALQNPAGGNSGFATLSSTGVLPVTQGGTGISGCSSRSIFVGSGTNTFSNYTLGTNVLNALVVTANWNSAIIANPMVNLGDTIYMGSGSPASATVLSGNTSTSMGVYTETGNGTTSAAPVWSTSLNASILGSGTVATARLGSGTASSSTYLRGDGTWATPSGGSGTVTSVSLTGDGVVYPATAGTAVTSSGTLTLPTPSNQAANTVFAGPASGSAAAPSFRALLLADIPSLSSLYVTPSSLSSTLGGYVPTTTTVNGHALSSNVVVSAGDLTTGVLGTAEGGAGTISGLLKANGSGLVGQASAGTDYLAPTGNGNSLTSINGVATTITATSAGTASAVTKAGATTGLTVDITGMPASTIENVPFSDTGFSNGDKLDVTVLYPATTGEVDFFDGTTSGTKVLATVGTSNGGKITHHFRFNSGAWTLVSEGSLYAKNANLAGGPVVTDSNNLIQYDARTMNSSGLVEFVTGDSLSSGYKTTNPAVNCWGYLLSQDRFFKGHLQNITGTLSSGAASGATTLNITVSSTVGFAKGQVLSATNLPTGTTVASVSGTLPSQTVTLATTIPGTGTISVDSSGNVTGVGTTFLTQNAVGQTFVAGGNTYTFSTITSNTAATASASGVISAQSWTFGGASGSISSGAAIATTSYYNNAVKGYTTAQIAALYTPDIYPHRPVANGGDGGAKGYLFYDGGTNDLVPFGATTTGTAAANQNQIVLTSIPSGMVVGNVLDNYSTTGLTEAGGAIPLSTTITAINTGTNTISLSANLTSAISSGTTVQYFSSAVQVIASITSYTTTARANGFTLTVQTLGPTNGYNNEYQRQLVNKILRAGGVPCDYLADPETILSQPLDTTLYASDNLHPNTQGHIQWEGYLEPGLQAGGFSVRSDEGTFAGIISGTLQGPMPTYDFNSQTGGFSYGSPYYKPFMTGGAISFLYGATATRNLFLRYNMGSSQSGDTTTFGPFGATGVTVDGSSDLTAPGYLSASTFFKCGYNRFSGTSTLSFTTAGMQVSDGASDTFSVPAPGFYANDVIFMKAAGTGPATISSSGSNIYDASAVSSKVLYPGQAAIDFCDGTNHNLLVGSVPSLETPNTTGTATFNTNFQDETIYNPTSSGTMSALAVTLPPASRPHQMCEYATGQAITAITMAGGTVDIGAAPGSAVAGNVFIWEADNTSGHWIRRQ